MQRFAIFVGLALALGCTEKQGSACKLDSDCTGGLLCAQDGVCRTAADPLNFEHLDAGAPPPAETTGGGGDAGVRPNDFGTGGGTCPAKTKALRVTKLALAKEGGFGKLADAANPTIQKDLDAGRIHVELWDDVTWVPFDEDGQAICSQIEPGVFTLTIPSFPVHTRVHDAALDATKTKLTGWTDKQEMISSMKCEIRTGANTLVEEDVDSDGDGKNDRVSVVLEVELSP